MTSKELRVAFPAKRKISSYDPSKIHLSYEYILLENIYSTLVEINPRNGKLIPGVAESYDWVNGELRFKIRKGLKTKSGYEISAEDAAFSLKRLIVLAANTHGNFKDIICPDLTLSSVEDECSGIDSQGESLILRPGGEMAILLPMLASIDFAIIPRHAVDPKSLEILDYSETSGVYHVDSDDGEGNIHLKSNTSHYHASNDFASTVRLVPFAPRGEVSAIDLFVSKQADHIMTTSATSVEKLLALAQEDESISAHATMKIKNIVLVFTQKGHKRLTADQRHSIGKTVRGVFQDIYKNTLGYQNSNEFFPALGEGGLTDEQRKELDAMTLAIKQNEKLPKIKIGLFKSYNFEEWAEPLRSRMPEADYYIEKNIPDLHQYDNEDDMPDAFIAATDTGFMEDINLISYSLNTGFLGLDKGSRAGWLKEYMSQNLKEKRIAALRDIHFQALKEPWIVPLSISSFVALTRKPWRMELSELYANNQLWLVKTH